MTLGTLYVVATPIGNLEDITLRALRILREVDVIAAEDTRVTRKLLSAHDLRTPMVAYHAHSPPVVERDLLERLEEGASIALVSDAGTPLISDPGGALVFRALEQGVTVIPVPGPSALLAALVGSGLPMNHFLFLGFLPRRAMERRELLGPLAHAPYTLVLFEAASRLKDTLGALRVVLGDRPATVARELSKRYETFVRGSLETLEAQFTEAPKGEVVVVVGPGEPEGTQSRDEIQATIERLVAQGDPPSEIARNVAGAFGLAKKEAYRWVLDVQDNVRNSNVNRTAERTDPAEQIEPS